MANEFVTRNGIISLGNVQVTGSITATGGITISGSIASASYAVSSSRAVTSSYSITSSYAVSSSYSLTSSYVNPLNQAVVVTGSLTVSGSSGTTIFNSAADTLVFSGSAQFTGSFGVTGSIGVTQGITASSILSTGNITAQTLIVNTISSSVVYSSGSNIFGNSLSNTQQLTGSVTVTGSLSVNGNSVVTSNQTSSMTVLSASYAQTASYFITGSVTSASYADTASYASSAVSSSYAVTASYATFALSASNSPGFTVNFSQSVAATTWSFTHNLDTRNPIVQVYDLSYNQIIPNAIVGINANTVEIRFDYTQAGYAVASNGGGLYVTGSTSQLNQTVAATTWSFNHRLNSQYVNFTVYDTNNYVIIPQSIQAVDTNNATILFPTAIAGTAVAQFSGINGAPNATTASYALTSSYVNALSQSVLLTGSMVITGSLTVSGSGTFTNIGPAVFSGSLTSTQGFTGSFSGTATTALTASSVTGLNQNVQITGSLTTTGQIVAQTLNVQQITSSIVYSSGSNIFGNNQSNVQQFTGSVSVTGSLTTSGAATFGSSVTAVGGNFTSYFKATGTAATPPNLAYLANNYFSKFFTRPDQNYGIAIFDQSLATAIQSADLVNGNSAQSLLLNPYGGNVGIGTTSTNVGGFGSTVVTLQSPNSTYATLEIGKTTASTSANLGVLSFFNGANGDVCNIIGVSEGANNTGALRFLTSGGSGGTERMRITSSGVIQLGNTTYSPYLTFRTGGGTTYAGVINMDTKNDYLVLNGGSTTGYGSGANISLIGSDRYGTNTAGQLELSAGNASNNTSIGYIAFYTANTLRMQISFNGAIGTTAGGTNIYNPSDIRLKKNIVEAPYGLNEILALKPSKFNWKDGFSESEKDKDMLGFIAQEIQTVIPEAVESFGQTVTVKTENHDYSVENPLRVNEKFIIPVLVKAIQEQQAQIEEMKAEIEALKAK